MRWILMIVVLILAASSTFAEETLTKRQQKRKIIPVSKLKKNLESSRRVKELQPDRVIEVIGVKKGQTVADIGAGTGFFTFRMADKVGVDGKVYAVEIEDELLEFMREKMEMNKVTNLILIKSSETASNLPPCSCDRILMVGSYYYLEDPVYFMSATRNALKPGGMVAIINLDEKKKKPPKDKKITFITRTKLTDEMKRAGFEYRETHEFLDGRYLMTFSVADSRQQCP